METLGNLVFGLGVALSWQNLLYCLIGCILGTVVGVLPGIGHTPMWDDPGVLTKAIVDFTTAVPAEPAAAVS